jgi:hypothetical protein
MSEPRLAGYEIRGGATAAGSAAIVGVIHEVLAAELAATQAPEDVRLSAWIRSGLHRSLAAAPEGW